MTRQLISSGSTFEQEIGYSRAVVDGDWVFLWGTTGFDYTTMSISDSLLAQTEQCLENIVSALRQPARAWKMSSVSRTSCPTARTLPNAGRCCASISERCGRRP